MRKKLRPSPAILYATITLDGKLVSDVQPRLARGDEEEQLDGAGCRERLLAKGVDEIFLTVRPLLDGQAGSDTLSGKPSAEFLPHSISLRLMDIGVREAGCVLHYKVSFHRASGVEAPGRDGTAGRP